MGEEMRWHNSTVVRYRLMSGWRTAAARGRKVNEKDGSTGWTGGMRLIDETANRILLRLVPAPNTCTREYSRRHLLCVCLRGRVSAVYGIWPGFCSARMASAHANDKILYYDYYVAADRNGIAMNRRWWGEGLFDFWLFFFEITLNVYRYFRRHYLFSSLVIDFLKKK